MPTNEILNADATVKNLILEGQFDKLQGIMDGSGDSKSFSFNADILRLINEGKISKADGLRFFSISAGSRDESQGYLYQNLRVFSCAII